MAYADWLCHPQHSSGCDPVPPTCGGKAFLYEILAQPTDMNCCYFSLLPSSRFMTPLSLGTTISLPPWVHGPARSFNTDLVADLTCVFYPFYHPGAFPLAIAFLALMSTKKARPELTSVAFCLSPVLARLLFHLSHFFSCSFVVVLLF